MALQKTFNLPNGASGNYVRIGAYSWDRMSREASVHLMLFASAAVAASNPDAPLCLVAKVRLFGTKFDEYLSTAVLDGLTTPGPDPVRDQLYAAAKAEPLVPGGGLTAVSFAGAVDV